MESILYFFLPPNMADAESTVNWISVGLWRAVGVSVDCVPFFFLPRTDRVCVYESYSVH